VQQTLQILQIYNPTTRQFSQTYFNFFLNYKPAALQHRYTIATEICVHIYTKGWYLPLKITLSDVCNLHMCESACFLLAASAVLAVSYCESLFGGGGGKQNFIIHPAAAAHRSCNQAGSMLPAVTLWMHEGRGASPAHVFSLVLTVYLALCAAFLLTVSPAADVSNGSCALYAALIKLLGSSLLLALLLPTVWEGGVPLVLSMRKQHR